MRNAGLLRGLGAALYDSLLVLALMFLGTLPFVAVRGGEPVSPGNTGYQLTILFIAFGFFVGFWAGHGRTLGMQSWGLRIETADGSRPTAGQCAMRFFAAILSWAVLGAGFWWQLVDREGLSWHDRLSGTRLRYYPKIKQG